MSDALRQIIDLTCVSHDGMSEREMELLTRINHIACDALLTPAAQSPRSAPPPLTTEHIFTLMALGTARGGLSDGTQRKLLDIADYLLSPASPPPDTLTDDERYLIEKARQLKQQGLGMVTTNHGVLMTYDEHARLAASSHPPRSAPPSQTACAGVGCPICNRSWALHDYASGDHCPPATSSPPDSPGNASETESRRVIDCDAVQVLDFGASSTEGASADIASPTREVRADDYGTLWLAPDCYTQKEVHSILASQSAVPQALGRRALLKILRTAHALYENLQQQLRAADASSGERVKELQEEITNSAEHQRSELAAMERRLTAALGEPSSEEIVAACHTASSQWSNLSSSAQTTYYLAMQNALTAFLRKRSAANE